MSRSAVIDEFFDRSTQCITELGLIDKPERIYNIDETWINPHDVKRQKIVTSVENSIAYRVFEGAQSHISFTMCACADGSIQPMQFVYKGSLPSSNDFYELGPAHAMYSCTDSGHTDSQTYFDYVKHLEPFLHRERPVIIYQDNLRAHENPALIEFCLSKGVHLFNFPPKLSHILQPLDKVFGPLKDHFKNTRHGAMLVEQRFISNAKIPVVMRFALTSLSKQTVRSAFQKTGIYPHSRNAIAADVLVGDDNCTASTSSTSNEALSMRVWDENDNEVNSEGPSDSAPMTAQRTEIGIQTDNVTSLPCSECVAQEVSLHPAVAAGVVSLDLASVLIQDGHSATRAKRTRRGKRDLPNGRWLTSETEIERIRKQELEKEAKEKEKKQRIEAREAKRVQHEHEKHQKKEMARQKQQERQQKKINSGNAKLGKLNAHGKCATCAIKPDAQMTIFCVFCNQAYHLACAHDASLALICGLCRNK